MYSILLVLITLGGVTLRGVIVNVLALVDKWIHIIRFIRYTFSITPAKVLLFFEMCKGFGAKNVKIIFRDSLPTASYYDFSPIQAGE